MVSTRSRFAPGSVPPARFVRAARRAAAGRSPVLGLRRHPEGSIPSPRTRSRNCASRSTMGRAPRSWQSQPQARTGEAAADDGETVIHWRLLRLCFTAGSWMSRALPRRRSAGRGSADHDPGGAERLELLPTARDRSDPDKITSSMRSAGEAPPAPCSALVASSAKPLARNIADTTGRSLYKARLAQAVSRSAPMSSPIKAVRDVKRPAPQRNRPRAAPHLLGVTRAADHRMASRPRPTRQLGSPGGRRRKDISAPARVPGCCRRWVVGPVLPARDAVA